MEAGVRETPGLPGGTRRLSIHTATARVDLVLSGTVAVGLLIPAIVDALAGDSNFDAGHIAVRYQLSTLAGTALEASKTLAELGIRDGTTLTLTCPPTDFTPAICDDTAEAVSAVVAASERRWSRPIAQSVGAVVASCWAGVGAVVLLRTAFEANAAHRAGCVGVAAAVSLLSLAAAAVAGRVFSEERASLMLGLMATGFAALTGLLAVPGGPGAPNALFAAAAGATWAAMVRMTACHAVLFEVLACFATTCLSAVLVCVLAAAPLPVVGPGLATISLAMIEVAPPLSVMIARLSPDAPASADRLRDSALRAHRRLTSVIAAFSASAALGAVSTLFRMSAASIVFAAVIGSVMLLRARTHQDVVRAAPLVVCGAVTFSAVFIAIAAGYPHRAPHVAVLATALGLLALYAGFVGISATVSPVGRRGVELLERFAFITVVPLTFWLCGLLGAARSVSLS
jgi:type VII secretion integral membrane protein EccD